MEVEQNKNPGEITDFPSEAEETLSNELNAPVWSVVSFDKRETENQTYAQAEAKMVELISRKVSGLCIITDEAAARMNS